MIIAEDTTALCNLLHSFRPPVDGRHRHHSSNHASNMDCHSGEFITCDTRLPVTTAQHGKTKVTVFVSGFCRMGRPVNMPETLPDRLDATDRHIGTRCCRIRTDARPFGPHARWTASCGFCHQQHQCGDHPLQHPKRSVQTIGTSPVTREIGGIDQEP